MFKKRLKQKGASEVNQWHVPKGALEPSQLNLHLTSHYGIPRTASLLSFDPIQRLLAIGTLDGRIKLFGRDGIEGLLQSDLQLRCKFLEFANNFGQIINITSGNDIQIWDLEKKVLAHSHRWSANITAFAVIQGSPYMYIGEDSGDVAVLQYDREENRLCQMPYCIPVHSSLGGIAEASYDSAPSVVDILPLPEADHSRVLIIYGNGSFVLWGLYDAQVLRVRGTGVAQWHKFSEEGSSEDDGEEEKDICCACWADPFGSLLAVGYTDGDIWFWSLAITSSGPLDPESPDSPSNLPLLKLQVSSSKSRSPVLVLRWCNVRGREGTTGVSGHLYVYGGGELGCSDILTIFSLKSTYGHLDAGNICRVEIPLNGPFDDMILLPSAGGTLSDPAAALLVLTSPGHLHSYDQASIEKYFLGIEEIMPSSLPEPVLINTPFTEPIITAAKIILLPDDGNTSNFLSQLPRSFRGIAPSVLPGGTKWPVTGGVLNKSLIEGSKVKSVFISGHSDGSVNVWDSSSSLLSHLCSLHGKAKVEPLESEAAPISVLDFCPLSGVFVVADESGTVCIYTPSADPGEVNCLFVNKSTNQDRVVLHDAGFQCIAVFNIHEAPISSLAVSSNPARVAVGSADGMVSLFDVTSRSILFNGYIFLNSSQRIVSLLFGPAPSLKDETCTPAASPPISPSRALQSESFPRKALYAAGEHASVVSVDGDTGQALAPGPWHSDHPSKALALHLLETANKIPFEQNDAKKTGDCEQFSEERIDECDDLTAISETDPASCYLLLCHESSIHLYCISTSKQVMCTPLQKVSLKSSCCWASTFVCQSANAAGLVLVDSTGSLQIRSIPDLEVVKEISLGKCLNWAFKSSLNFSRTITCAANGQMALVDGNRELIFFSLLATKDDLRVTDSLACFFDKDIAAAADAATRAGSHPTRRKSQIQGFIGGVLKDLKGGVLKDLKGGVLKELKVGVLKELKGGLLKSTKSAKEPIGMNAPADLSRLFATSPTTVTSASPHLDRQSQSESAGSTAVELDIDDIDIEDDEVSSLDFGSTSGEMSVPSLKGKEKQSDIADDRVKLFGGQDEVRKPTKRTAEEIRAAYGQRKTGEVAGAAGLARDKLLERQEKLEALGKRTEELQDGAENFSSMAAELAKAMEGRKWWQL